MSCKTTLLASLLFLPTLLWGQANLNINVRATEGDTLPRVFVEKLLPDEFRVEVTRNGRPVENLTADDFVAQTPLTSGRVLAALPIIHTEKANLSVALCIDNSASMQPYVTRLRKTLEDLINSFGPAVRLFALWFSRDGLEHSGYPFEVSPHIRVEALGENRAAITDTLERRLHPKALQHVTYLYDAMYTAVQLLNARAVPGEKRFVVVLSDGRDMNSKYTSAHVRLLLQRFPETRVYAVDFLTEPNPVLQELAEMSGGKYYQAQKAEELAGIFAKISRDIKILQGYLVKVHLPVAYLTGRLRPRDGCDPLANTKLVCYPVQKPDYRVPVELKENGLFAATVEYPYDWQLVATAEGYLPDTTVVSVRDDDLFWVDVDLKPAIVQLSGRVTDSGVSPLFGARVTVTNLTAKEKVFEGVTDSLGHYAFEILSGSNVLVTATKDGYTFGSVEVSNVNSRTRLPDISLGLTAEGLASEFRFLFEFDSDRLDTADVSTRVQLEGCTKFVKRELAKSEARTVRLEGWTDYIGTPEYNLDLSNRRARNVKRYLVARGVPAHRIEAVGKGISHKYDNTSKEGRALNRRTDVIFFDRAPLASEKN